MIKNVLLVAALVSATAATAHAEGAYPAPRSLVSTDQVAWDAGPLAARAETGLTEIRVTTRQPFLGNVGHYYDIQLDCANGASNYAEDNYFTVNGDMQVSCPDDEILQKADVVIFVD